MFDVVDSLFIYDAMSLLLIELSSRNQQTHSSGFVSSYIYRFLKIN